MPRDRWNVSTRTNTALQPWRGKNAVTSCVSGSQTTDTPNQVAGVSTAPPAASLISRYECLAWTDLANLRRLRAHPLLFPEHLTTLTYCVIRHMSIQIPKQTVRRSQRFRCGGSSLVVIGVGGVRHETSPYLHFGIPLRCIDDVLCVAAMGLGASIWLHQSFQITEGYKSVTISANPIYGVCEYPIFTAAYTRAFLLVKTTRTLFSRVVELVARVSSDRRVFWNSQPPRSLSNGPRRSVISTHFPPRAPLPFSAGTDTMNRYGILTSDSATVR
ncbi:uncharacterized protein CLUP02_15045 [Colletotrichum lupini]|uniref:Uncharacterized protein n=1 Tax=Colletotrichum lupini TaxID=145971 RepID=A0A9Q8WN62_9PEZI|nr:uncharacterized protein CLUP02_15045 [Colletotrichum lupini]UQC89514.1 hypothetical protein CLUP02_15045 [Colletotrichum lupini]